MKSRFHRIAAVGLVLLLAGAVNAQRREEHPKLRAALHELREARAEVQGSRGVWPEAHTKRAVEAMDDAIKSLAAILEVKDIRAFRGVERRPEFYKRFKEHAHLRAALQDLREARRDLHDSRADFRGMKERALDDLDVATGEILTLLRYKRR
jgi:hypothetical protein